MITSPKRDVAGRGGRYGPFGVVVVGCLAGLFTMAASAQQLSSALSSRTATSSSSIAGSRTSIPQAGSVIGAASVTFNSLSASSTLGGQSVFDAARDTFDQLLADVSSQTGLSVNSPVAWTDLYITSEGTPLNVARPGVLANDTSRTGNALTAQLVSGPTNGTLTLRTDGSFVYTPKANFNGIDTFRYKASDGAYLSNIATVAIRVNAVNNPPVAMADSGTTPEDTPLTLNVLSNDRDPDNNALRIASVTPPTNGSATITGTGSIYYVPRANFYGTDRFTYTISDDQGGSSSATVTVTVTSVNDPPVVRDVVTSTAQNTPVTIAALAGAVDPDNDVLRVSAVTQPTNGTVTQAVSNLTYTPRSNFVGTDTFTYTVTDGKGGSATARVTISVAAAPNAAPVARDDSVTTTEDAAVDIDVLANDSDANGDTLSVTAVTQPQNGRAVITGTRVAYSPNANFVGTDTFTYTVSDGKGGMANASVTVQVTTINDAPTARDDSFSAMRNTVNMKLDVLANDTDVDAGDTLRVSALGTPNHGGVVTVDGTGAVLYTPARDFAGSEVFTYTVADAAGATATANVTITVVSPSKVGLRLLIISTGTAAQDARLDYLDDVLGEMGVPYDVLDASRQTLTPAMLSTGDRGFYNGIILTDTELFLTGGGSGFTLEEWRTLHEYERTFGVRESVISGFPATNAALDLDYGMMNFAAGSLFLGRWLAPAGGPELFEYVNPSAPLPITDFALTGEGVLYYTAQPRTSGTGPAVQPLLVAQGSNGTPDPKQILVSMLRYPDGREVLLSTIANAWFLIHSQVLAYEFINFATKGVFIGGRHVYLEAHVDDLCIEDDLWIPASNVTVSTPNYRMSAADVSNAVAAQRTFRTTFPLMGQFRLDFPFNGEGCVSGDPLTAAIVANRNEFRFINHTFGHLDMDVSSGATYQTAYDQIALNRQVWTTLNLPERVQNNVVLVSGDHSGLRDDRNTPDRADDIEYPDGANHEFLRAAQALGIRYLASDSSQIRQNVETFVPGFDILLLPRWPTSVFYNVTTPEELTDEYNYIFHERYLELGQDPCTIPGAICTPRTYPQILAAEAETTLRHMLSYRPWPHYFHQSNLRAYSGQSATLQFDWLNAALNVYASLISLPVVSLPYYEIGRGTEQRLIADQADVTGEWDLTTNRASIWAAAPVNTPSSAVDVLVTGVSGAQADYGGQSIQTLSVSSAPQLYAVDRALNR